MSADLARLHYGETLSGSSKDASSSGWSTSTPSPRRAQGADPRCRRGRAAVDGRPAPPFQDVSRSTSCARSRPGHPAATANGIAGRHQPRHVGGGEGKGGRRAGRPEVRRAHRARRGRHRAPGPSTRSSPTNPAGRRGGRRVVDGEGAQRTQGVDSPGGPGMAAAAGGRRRPDPGRRFPDLPLDTSTTPSTGFVDLVRRTSGDDHRGPRAPARASSAPSATTTPGPLKAGRTRPSAPDP